MVIDQDRMEQHVLVALRHPTGVSEIPYWWWTLRQLQSFIKKNFGVMYSEADISARLRDLRKAGYRIEKRSYLYRLNGLIKANLIERERKNEKVCF